MLQRIRTLAVEKKKFLGIIVNSNKKFCSEKKIQNKCQRTHKAQQEINIAKQRQRPMLTKFHHHLTTTKKMTMSDEAVTYRVMNTLLLKDYDFVLAKSLSLSEKQEYLEEEEVPGDAKQWPCKYGMEGLRTDAADTMALNSKLVQEYIQLGKCYNNR